jgi:transposase
MRYKEGQDKNQICMLGNSLDEYIDEDHICRIIDAFVEKLDMVALGFTHSVTKEKGQCPYNPKMFAKLYIYGYLNKIRSSKRLQAETLRNIEVMWLLDKLTPDDKTISNFRHDNAKPLREMFRTFCKMINCWGLYGKTTIAIDGTKIRANNSRKKNFNEKNVKKKLEILEKQISEYMNMLDENDNSEKQDTKIDESKIKEVLAYLKDKKTEFDGYLKRIDENDGKEISVTDEDCRLMKEGGNHGMDCCYNVEAAVDDKHNLIIHSEVSQSPVDTNELKPAVEAVKREFDIDSLNALADKGFYNPKDILHLEKNGVTCYIPKPKNKSKIADENYHLDKFSYSKETNTYICPMGHILSKTSETEKNGILYFIYTNKNACKDCNKRDKCTSSKSGFRSIQRSELQSEMDEIDKRFKESYEIYKRRQAIVEHPFGTIKRAWGFDHFLCKGKEMVGAENALASLAYNLRRVINILGAKKLISELI